MFNSKKIEALEERIKKLEERVSCLKGNHSPGQIEFHPSQYLGGGLSQLNSNLLLSGGQWTKEYSTIHCTSCGVLLKKFTPEENPTETKEPEQKQ